MAFFVLEYHYVPDMLERRDEFRPAHLEHLRTAHERGEVVMAGALADPVDRGLLIWSVENRGRIEAFAAADPYVTGGLVVSSSIRAWNVVVGG